MSGSHVLGLTNAAHAEQILETGVEAALHLARLHLPGQGRRGSAWIYWAWIARPLMDPKQRLRDVCYSAAVRREADIRRTGRNRRE